MLAQLENAIPDLEEELKNGKVLMKDANAPSFVQQTVEDVENRLKYVDDKAHERYRALKVFRLFYFALFLTIFQL